MRIFRYKTISTLPSSEPDGRLTMITTEISKEYGDYIVDDSAFVPMSEAVKRVTGGALSQQDIKTMYDFPTGKVATAFKLPVDRTHAYTGDIAEVSKAVREAAKGAQEELEEAKRQFDFEQRLNAINNPQKESTPAPSQSGK